jgi:hypothetical protein
MFLGTKTNCSDACRESGGGERNQREEEEEAAGTAAAEAGNGSQLVMPEDGYEWKKYGQKFIKNIQKIRYLLRSTSIYRTCIHSSILFLALIDDPRQD